MAPVACEDTLYCKHCLAAGCAALANKVCGGRTLRHPTACRHRPGGLSLSLVAAAARQVDVKHKRCMHDGCLKRPSFNYSGETRALYCGPHRLQHMVNVDQQRRRINRGKCPVGKLCIKWCLSTTQVTGGLAFVNLQLVRTRASFRQGQLFPASPAHLHKLNPDQGWRWQACMCACADKCAERC